MPLKKEEKELIVQELRGEFEKSAGIVLTDYQGLNVAKINQFRKELKEKGIKFKVYKNTLIKRASQELSLDYFSKDLSGCTAIAFSLEEPILTVKLLYRFAQENKEFFKLKKALVEGQVFFDEQLDKIANLPPKDELLSQLLGNMKSPITSFVLTIQAPIMGLVHVLNQISQQKGQSDSCNDK